MRVDSPAAAIVGPLGRGARGHEARAIAQPGACRRWPEDLADDPVPAAAARSAPATCCSVFAQPLAQRGVRPLDHREVVLGSDRRVSLSAVHPSKPEGYASRGLRVAAATSDCDRTHGGHRLRRRGPPRTTPQYLYMQEVRLPATASLPTRRTTCAGNAPNLLDPAHRPQLEQVRRAIIDGPAGHAQGPAGRAGRRSDRGPTCRERRG